MKNNRVFIPLALIGVIFAAIAVSLRIFYKAPPLWTTTSPRTQNGYTFIGVYNGKPQHLAGPYTYYGKAPRYSGDMWAYFKVDSGAEEPTTSSQLIGKDVASPETFFIRKKRDLSSSSKDQTIIAVQVPSQYPPGLRNSKLVLYGAGRTIGSWELRGMPEPIAAIQSSEPDRLQASGAGWTLKLSGPAVQRTTYSAGAPYPTQTLYDIKVDASPDKPSSSDSYEAEFMITRTDWTRGTVLGTQTIALPSKGGIVSYQPVDVNYEPTRRIELTAVIRRYRILEDEVVLRNAMVMKDANGNYLLRGCQNETASSAGGASVTVEPGGPGYLGPNGESVLKVRLRERPMPAARRTTSRIGIVLKPAYRAFDDRNLHSAEVRLPKNSAAASITIPALRVKFMRQELADYKVVRLLGSVRSEKKTNAP